MSNRTSIVRRVCRVHVFLAALGLLELCCQHRCAQNGAEKSWIEVVYWIKDG